jgi:hypothetical protein
MTDSDRASGIVPAASADEPSTSPILTAGTAFSLAGAYPPR